LKIHLAGFLAVKEQNLSSHLFFKLQKLNRLMSYYDIKENRSNSKEEFEIVKNTKDY